GAEVRGIDDCGELEAFFGPVGGDDGCGGNSRIEREDEFDGAGDDALGGEGELEPFVAGGDFPEEFEVAALDEVAGGIAVAFDGGGECEDVECFAGVADAEGDGGW